MSHELEVDKIIVGDRFRKLYRDIDTLGASLAKYGLLHPIVVDRSNNLIAGGRRLTAARSIGWLRIPVTYRDEIDPLTARELELEENIQRDDLEWGERVALVAEIDRIKRLLYGSDTSHQASVGWDMADTALSMGVSQPTISRDLMVARMIAICPSIAQAPDRKAAMKLFDKELEDMERELAIRRQTLRDPGFSCGDSLVLVKDIPDASIDLILTDPPYGTNIDNMNLGALDKPHFADTLDSLRGIAPDLRRVLKPDAHAYFFCGILVMRETLDILEAAGFHPDPIHLVWIKTTAGLVDFSYRYPDYWEPILYCHIGSSGRRLSRHRPNVFTYPSVPSDERTNIAQKPVELLCDIISMSTQEGEIVYDPFAASGSTLVAAKQMNRKYIGSEQDRDQYNAGLLRLVPPTPLPDPDLNEEDEEAPCS